MNLIIKHIVNKIKIKIVRLNNFLFCLLYAINRIIAKNTSNKIPEILDKFCVKSVIGQYPILSIKLLCRLKIITEKINAIYGNTI